MWSRAWHSWFSVKLCLPPAPTPVVKSERICLLLTQSEWYSIERFADYLPMPLKSSHFFEVWVSVFQRISHPETRWKQTKSRATPVELNSAEIFENLASWPQWRETASKRLCNLPEVAQQIGAEAKIVFIFWFLGQDSLWPSLQIPFKLDYMFLWELCFHIFCMLQWAMCLDFIWVSIFDLWGRYLKALSPNEKVSTVLPLLPAFYFMLFLESRQKTLAGRQKKKKKCTENFGVGPHGSSCFLLVIWASAEMLQGFMFAFILK